MINKDDMKWLSQFENNFNSAIKSNYSRNILVSQLNRMQEIYELSTGKRYDLCTHCSSSVLSFLKVIGKIYLDQKGFETTLKDNELKNVVTNKEVKVKRNGKSTKG